MTPSNGHRTHFRTCTLCEAMCGIAITLDGDNILAIKGDDADPFSQGHICPKATALQDIYHDPDRLKQPVRRTKAGWETISWDDAFDEVANQIQRIQTKYGRNSIGLYLGNPNVHNLGSILMGSSFYRTLGTQNLFTATSVDQLPHHVAARHMFGHYFLLGIPDLERTSHLLILGANPLASNGSLMSTGGAKPRLNAIQKRGGKIVVVDPRRTETAVFADQHHFIRPGSDVLLLLALTHVLFAENLVNPDHLRDFVDGIAVVQSLADPYPPQRVAAATGIPAATIRQLARELARADSAAVYGRMGLSVQQFGGLCNWLINVLNILTGNLDKPGGVMFPTPAFDLVQSYNKGKQARWHSRVRGVPEFTGELPATLMAEEMLTPGTGQIKGFITIAGNPVLSTPNGRQLDSAFSQLEFMLAIDIYINETTRHANIILPPATGLEVAHYDVSFHTLAVRNTAKYSEPLFPISQNQRYDWQITRELTKRLATEKRPFNSSDPRNSLTPSQLLDFGLQSGPHGITLQQLKENPHGIDLGPLQPRLPERLFTPDKRIQLAPDALISDLPRVEKRFFAGETAVTGTSDTLSLIGRRDLRSNNSWMHNSERLVKGKERCVLLIHPDDAATRQLAEGATATVSSRVGTVTLPVQISDEMMPGVVSIPHGWGHGLSGVQLHVARAHPGVSVNDLTDDQQLDELTGNAVLNGVPVMVSPAN